LATLRQAACPARLAVGPTPERHSVPFVLLARRLQLPACRLTLVILLLEGRPWDALLAMLRQAARPARLAVGRMPERQSVPLVPLARLAQLPAFRPTHATRFMQAVDALQATRRRVARRVQLTRIPARAKRPAIHVKECLAQSARLRAPFGSVHLSISSR